MTVMDSPDNQASIARRIRGKPSLRALYREFYRRYADCRGRAAAGGVHLEIGSGAGFIKEVSQNVFTSDILAYDGVDLVLDARELPFGDGALSSVFMLNTLHHVPDAGRFFGQLSRCLKPGGRALIIDQYAGRFSAWIYRRLHHEPYDEAAKNWKFASTGPLSGANGALCWMIFFRDRERFGERYPRLKIVRSDPHTPFRYWLTGGLKRWNLLPECLFGAWTGVDRAAGGRFPEICSFVDIELVRV